MKVTLLYLFCAIFTVSLVTLVLAVMFPTIEQFLADVLAEQRSASAALDRLRHFAAVAVLGYDGRAFGAASRMAQQCALVNTVEIRAVAPADLAARVCVVATVPFGIFQLAAEAVVVQMSSFKLVTTGWTTPCSRI